MIVDNKLKLIGRGSFSRVYQGTNKDIVIIKSCDPIKECMSMGWFPDSNIFPKVTRLDNGFYKMKYYTRSQGYLKYIKYKSHRKLYQQINRMYKETSAISCINPHQYLDLWRGHINAYITGKYRRILIEALEACGNYGNDVIFEWSSRNITTYKGRLILLDCFFILSKLREVIVQEQGLM